MTKKLVHVSDSSISLGETSSNLTKHQLTPQHSPIQRRKKFVPSSPGNFTEGLGSFIYAPQEKLDLTIKSDRARHKAFNNESKIFDPPTPITPNSPKDLKGTGSSIESKVRPVGSGKKFIKREDGSYNNIFGANGDQETQNNSSSKRLNSGIIPNGEEISTVPSRRLHPSAIKATKIIFEEEDSINNKNEVEKKKQSTKKIFKHSKNSSNIFFSSNDEKKSENATINNSSTYNKNKSSIRFGDDHSSCEINDEGSQPGENSINSASNFFNEKSNVKKSTKRFIPPPGGNGFSSMADYCGLHVEDKVEKKIDPADIEVAAGSITGVYGER